MQIPPKEMVGIRGLLCYSYQRMRFLSAILTALVFQVVQITPVFGVVDACPSVAGKAPVCACCEGLAACPCVEQGEPAPTPQPLPPLSSEALKVPVSAVTDVRVAIAGEVLANPLSLNPPQASFSAMEFYRGVSLGTAFCSFLI